MPFADFHTHTVFSDGGSTVREMIDAARAKGLSALGISDHSYTPFDTSYCIRREALEQYGKAVREEQQIARERYDFPVLLGLELDAYSAVGNAQYDYTIGSVHYLRKDGEFFPVDDSAYLQERIIMEHFGGNSLDFAKAYFEQVVAHAEKNRPTFIGHFDLLTKYNLINEHDSAYLAVAREAITETLKYVPLFEVNMGAIVRGLRTVPYPAPPLLTELCKQGGKVILSSDAHCADTIAFRFSEAIEIIKAAGFTKISRLTQDGITEDKI